MKTPPNPTGPQPGVTPEMVVRVRAAELHGFTSTHQFDRVAAEHKFTDTRSFERYLTALLVEAGIDYEGLRQTEAARRSAHQRLVAVAARGPRLMLWSAATMTTFTVCRADGQVIWHDLFLRDTAPCTGSAAAEASARQAIWLAGRARTGWGAEAATLRLILARSRGVDLENLHRAAATADLVLDVATNPVHNPAAEQCTRRDAVDWRSSDLGGLRHPHRGAA
ncbi:hypothetical protein IU450_28250 [Nocardia abscessus]|uniref:hypothetical protein n=1 Tax=Nocardia abscessus TaxID=120957 RepID=UPI00189636D6|nr:hypothetical protein [Nocardia abscessus]MBF6339751.1 hypothetical protein [Nocardia abscessus]